MTNRDEREPRHAGEAKRTDSCRLFSGAPLKRLEVYALHADQRPGALRLVSALEWFTQ